MNSSLAQLGEIKQSILTIEKNQELYGYCWVKMSGQNISGSDVTNVSGINSLPNSAGRFLGDIGGNTSALG